MSAPETRPAPEARAFIQLTPQEVTSRKRRNLAIAAALVGFIVLVFLVTVLNLQRNVADREAAQAAAAAPSATRDTP